MYLNPHNYCSVPVLRVQITTFLRRFGFKKNSIGMLFLEVSMCMLDVEIHFLQALF